MQPPTKAARAAAEAEVHDSASGGGLDDARGLGGDERGEVDHGEQVRLDELRLGQRRGDLQDRLVGEDDGALGHRADLAGEAEAREVGVEILRHRMELRQAAQVVELLRGEADGLKVVQRLLDAGDDEEAAVRGEVPDEQLEGRHVGHVVDVVGGGHGELVQVGPEAETGVDRDGSRPPGRGGGGGTGTGADGRTRRASGSRRARSGGRRAVRCGASGSGRARALHFGTFSQSLRNFWMPTSVSGCLSSCSRTLYGTVATWAPSIAASTKCSGLRIEATMISAA
jgi:hypothetical protein